MSCEGGAIIVMCPVSSSGIRKVSTPVLHHELGHLQDTCHQVIGLAVSPMPGSVTGLRADVCGTCSEERLWLRHTTYTLPSDLILGSANHYVIPVSGSYSIFLSN